MSPVPRRLPRVVCWGHLKGQCSLDGPPSTESYVRAATEGLGPRPALPLTGVLQAGFALIRPVAAAHHDTPASPTPGVTHVWVPFPRRKAHGVPRTSFHAMPATYVARPPAPGHVPASRASALPLPLSGQLNTRGSFCL
uniref:Uncharacterized protein n=1 Tax=Timema monikensis TaxID=170555 RepID=A0A7R9EAS0_9NEOP|nr:unnamed protein product [Timema monikensis]